jgi:hypothetical protein
LQSQFNDRAANNIIPGKNVPNLILAMADVLQDKMLMIAIWKKPLYRKKPKLRRYWTHMMLVATKFNL